MGISTQLSVSCRVGFNLARLVLLCLSCFSISVWAEDASQEQAKFYWRGGGGNWSDRANWSTSSKSNEPVSRYPGEDPSITNDIVEFTKDSYGSITTDVDVTIYRIVVNSAATLETNPLTFESPAGVKRTIQTTSTNNSSSDRNMFSASRRVFFRNAAIKGSYLDFRGDTHVGEGAELTASKLIYLWDAGANISFEEGCTVNSSVDAMRNGVKFFFKGGTVNGSCGSGSNNGRFSCYLEFTGGEHNVGIKAVKGTSIKITGGIVKLNKTCEFDGTEEVVFTGGKVVWGGSAGSLKNSKWLGTDDAVLEYAHDSRQGFNLFSSNCTEVYHDTTLWATGGEWKAFYATNSASLYGTGTMYLRDLYLNTSEPFNCSYSGLIVFGERGIRFQKSGTINLLNGGNFGSYDDWGINNNGGGAGSVYMNGDFIFDTGNAFDDEKNHDITLKWLMPKFGTSVEVQGGGTLHWKEYNASYVRQLSLLKVGEGASFVKTDWKLLAEKVILEENATLKIPSNGNMTQISSIEADPTASINVVFSSAPSFYARPFVDFSDTEVNCSAIQSLVKYSGPGLDNYEARCENGCMFLQSKAEFDYGSCEGSNVWIGASTEGGNTSDGANWAKGEPIGSSSNNKLYFDGFNNLYVTNKTPNLSFGHCYFKNTAGPFVIRGESVKPNSYAYDNDASSSFVSKMPFPITIEADVNNSASRLSALADSGSIRFAGYVNGKKGFFYSGDIRISGNVYADSIYPRTSSTDSATELEVMNGGQVTVSNQVDMSSSGGTTYRALFYPESRLNIRKGGVVRFLNHSSGASRFGMLTSPLGSEHFVDGELEVLCPMVGTVPMVFGGSGKMHVETTMSSNKNASVVIGGGLTFTSGKFYTVTEENPDCSINIVVTNSATFGAVKNWSYGPQEGVATSTEPYDRAVQIAEGATLTVDSGDYTITFGEHIIGDGRLVFAEGAKIQLGGSLAQAAKGNWIPFATVREIEGMPVVPAHYLVRVVDNDNGTDSLEVKIRLGLSIVIR